MVKSWKSEELCTFHRFLGFGDTSTLQKSFKSLRIQYISTPGCRDAPFSLKRWKMLLFALKMRKSAIFIKFPLFSQKERFCDFLRFPDLRGPRGAPGGAGRGPRGLPTRNFEKSEMLRNRYRQPKGSHCSMHVLYIKRWFIRIRVGPVFSPSRIFDFHNFHDFHIIFIKFIKFSKFHENHKFLDFT